MNKMNSISPSLVALLSTLISQLTLLILLLLPNSHSSSLVSPTLSSLILHFISNSNTLLSLTLSRKRKRKRPHFTQPKPHRESPRFASRLAQLVRIDSPDSFRSLFRMTPSTFEWLSGLLEPLLECRDPVNSPLNIPSELRLGIGLYRLSTGSDYPEVATRFGVSESVAIFCTKQLCRVLCTNFRFWVGFPNSDEFDSVTHKFQHLTGLPNCCGVIGCTAFNFTRKTNGKNKTIAAQIVIDSSCRILSIYAGCDGDKSNVKVLKSSTLYKDILAKKLLNSPPMYVDGVGINQYLVGDQGYPLLPWLMVAFDDPNPGSNEERFNNGVSVMNGLMRKSVGSLKSWGILRKLVKEEARNVVGYIGACAILHNALLLREDYTCLSEFDYSHEVEHDGCCRDVCLVDVEEECGGLVEGSVIRNVLATKVMDRIEID